MVMKKIIAFIICLALCVSGLAVGVMNQEAKNGAEVLGAANNAVIGAGSNALDRVDQGISALVGNSNTGVDIQKLPTIATENLNGGSIVPTDDGYELTGNITITTGKELADVAAALNLGKTFDGKGYTITIASNTPIFGSEPIFSGTMKNFAVSGTYETSNAITGAIAHFLKDVTVDEETKTVGNVVINNVIVDVDMTMKVADSNGSGGFFGHVGNNTQLDMTNCAFTGTIKPSSNSLKVRGGGFFGIANGSAVIDLTNCTASGTLEFSCHQGGFVGDLNSSAKMSFDKCYSNVYLNMTNTIAETGQVGGYVGWMSGTAIFSAENCLSEASFKLNNAGHFTGGYIGDNNGRQASFTNCISNVTNYSWVSGFAQDTFFGGFIGGTRNPSVSTTISFVDCENRGNLNLTIPQANIGLAYGGFVGRHNTGGTTLNETFVFTNCVNNADITINSASNATGRNMNIGGFFGMLRAANLTATNCINNGDLTYTQTVANAGHYMGGLIGTTHEGGITLNVNGFVNNGNITSTVYGKGNSYIGGVIGHINAAPNTFTLDNCVNTGDISLSSHKDAALDRVEAGGILGCQAATSTNVSYITNCINLGDVTVINNSEEDKNDSNSYQMRAGGIAATVQGKVMLDSCINAGTVAGTVGKTSDSGESAVGLGQPVGGLFGLCGSRVYRSVNLGDVSSNSNSAAAIAGYFNASTTASDVRYCVNMGNITSEIGVGGSFLKSYTKAAKDPNNEEDTAYVTSGAFNNCFNGGTIATVIATNEAGNVAGEYTGEITGLTTVDVDLPAYLSAASVKASGATNAQAYIALVFANIDEDLTAYYVDYIKAFTVDATLTDGICYTNVNKAFYDGIETIAGDSAVAFDGIVTPVRVANAIIAGGKLVTVDTLAELSEEKNYTLYFNADRDAANIVSGDTVENGAYKIKIVLRNPSNLADGYTARAFIKIGNAYIYSTAPAPAAE